VGFDGYPDITSKIGVNDNPDGDAEQLNLPPGSLIDRTSDRANNQISGKSQNADISDFEDPSNIDPVIARQSIGFARILQKAWTAANKNGCKSQPCCDEITIRIVSLGQGGLLAQRLAYINSLKPGIKSEFTGENGLVTDGIDKGNTSKKIRCKK
jgi:hypothetical protein